MDMNNMSDKKQMHGGDIYRNQVKLDFSVNMNPLGVPEAVKAALYEAVENCSTYPDIEAEHLKKAVSEMLDVPEEYLLFGNGASELFMAIVHGIRPNKTVIPVPSFYGYEHAAEALGRDVRYYEMKPEHGFALGEDFFEVLTEEVELLFLANPNNPTGNLISQESMRELLRYCREKGIFVVLDECFIEFCDRGLSMLHEIEQFENLILVRAFTKIYSIPGVRLGYLVCGNRALNERIKRQLPEWNLSGFAQAAGCACASQTGFIESTKAYIKTEREFLKEGICRLGVNVLSGEANYLLVFTEEDLYSRLLEKGILIRDCGNFKGLSKGFYRIAVKSRRENEILLKAMGEIDWKNQIR